MVAAVKKPAPNKFLKQRTLIIPERIFYHHLNTAPGNHVMELVEEEESVGGKEERI